MRKYLMTGMAALAISAAFTSCSKETNLYNEEVIKENTTQNIINNYNEAFIKTFGQPASNQNWGFIDYSKARTRTAYPNGNMWAQEGWNVPPVISTDQKNIVRQYFQQNQNPRYNDPGWTDFWIQQVYDGGSNTEGSLSTESYLSANGGSVVGGEHMDHLVAVFQDGKQDHVYNFNNADNNAWEGRMLMKSSSTYSFGYITSEASVYHNDKAGLVNWRVIAEWAVEKGLENSVEESVLNDGWNRSYMGFDYEQLDEKDVYSKNSDGSIKMATYAGPANPQYIWDGTNVTKVFNQVNWQNVPIEGYEHMTYNNREVPLVSMNANQFNGTKITVSENDLKIEKVYPETGETVLCLNMEYIEENLLSQGYLPQDNGTNKDWVKVCPAADGYYSDWIVTLTEASQYTLRVICEDLNAQAQEGDPEDSDWDFNDLVFDVKFLGDDKVNIKVVAVGGTLPIRVAGREAHGLFGEETNIMINTGAEAKFPNQAATHATLPTFDVTIDGVEDSYGGNIPVEVYKNDEWIPLYAKAGSPASKMGVMPDFQICTERENINGRYSNFRAWVAKVDPIFWWRPTTTNE